MERKMFKAEKNIWTVDDMLASISMISELLASVQFVIFGIKNCAELTKNAQTMTVLNRLAWFSMLVKFSYAIQFVTFVMQGYKFFITWLFLLLFITFYFIVCLIAREILRTRHQNCPYLVNILTILKLQMFHLAAKAI